MEVSPQELFVDYKEELDEYIYSARDMIAELSGGDIEGNMRKVEEIEKQLSNAEASLEYLRLLKDKADSDLVNLIVTKIHVTEKWMEDLREQMKSDKWSRKIDTRSQLLGEHAELATTSLDHRDQLKAVTQKTEENLDKMDEVNVVILSTIDTGTQILVELDEQRSMIERMQGKIKDINLDLDTAKRLTKSIGRGLLKGKIILMISLCMIIMVILIVVYIKYFWGMGFSTDHPSPPSPANSTQSILAHMM